MNTEDALEAFCSKSKVQGKHVHLTAKIRAQGTGDQCSLSLC